MIVFLHPVRRFCHSGFVTLFALLAVATIGLLRTEIAAKGAVLRIISYIGLALCRDTHAVDWQ